MTDDQWIAFADGSVKCAVCARDVVVIVMARFEDVDGVQIELKPDMSRVWEHMLAHNRAGELG